VSGVVVAVVSEPAAATSECRGTHGGMVRGIDVAVEEFLAPRLFIRGTVLARPCPVPAARGWWFREPPALMDIRLCDV